MKFSIAEPPPEIGYLPGVDIAILEAGEGRTGMFVHTEDTKYLNFTTRQNNSGISSQWQLERTISLDPHYMFIRSTGRHLFLYQWQSPSLDAGFFSLDANAITLQLESVFASNSCIPCMRAYSSFPPSLLLTPTVCQYQVALETVRLRRHWN